MLLMPLGVLVQWLVGLALLVLLGGGIYLVWAWWTGVVVGTAYLVAGLAMLAPTLLGRPLVLLLRRPGRDEPRLERGGVVQRIERPDGTTLHVESYGPAEALPIVLTHGWGTNSTVWYYVKKALSSRFRLICWDLRGLGESTGPHDHDYSLERMAHDLHAVVGLAGDRPAVLVGHSIGGMIALTYCRLYARELTRRVAGLVLLDTTYTNPVRTSTASGLLQALQKPLLEPLLHLTVWLSPLVWLLNWLSYFNGAGHIASMLTGFAGHETRGQLDVATRYTPLASPAVQARGALAMLHWDETATLARIPVPVLVLVGHLDRMATPEASRDLQQRLPVAQMAELRPGGHMSLFEQHDQLTDALTTFAAGLSSRADGRSLRSSA